MKIKVGRLLILITLMAILLTSVFLLGKQIFRKPVKTEKPSEKPNPVEKIPNTFLNKLNNDKELDSDIEDLIVKYMDSYYKSMYTLEYNDIKSLFSDEEESYITETTIQLLINHRLLQTNDMKMDDAKYDITIKSVEEDNGIITIVFLEDDYFKFKYLNGIESKAFGVKNTIKIKKIEDEYKIVSLRKVQDYYVMITNEYTKQNNLEQAISKLEKLKNDYISEMKKEIALEKTLKEKYLKGEDKITLTCDNKYDREKAINYSKKYITERNSDWYAYDNVGGNCQNYVSQILYEGGIPMDYSGNIYNQWKHYSATVNEKSENKGRSYSWTTVGYFYDYAKNNKESGLCSSVDANMYYAEAGDVAHVGYDNRWNHAVIIVDQVKDAKGEIVDFLINSNTVNLENYPLLAYVYPQKRVIKIMGWNN